MLIHNPRGADRPDASEYARLRTNLMRHRNGIALAILSLGLTLIAVMLLTGPREAEAAALATSCDIKVARKLADGGEPAWSPDGQQLAYHRWDDDGVYQLRIMGADGSNDRCLSCAAAPGSPSG